MSGNLSEIRLFLVELRKETGDDIEISVRRSGPSKYALRGKEWIAAGLIDTIVDGKGRMEPNIGGHRGVA